MTRQSSQFFLPSSAAASPIGGKGYSKCFRICLLGDSRTGKSNVLNRFAIDNFVTDYKEASYDKTNDVEKTIEIEGSKHTWRARLNTWYCLAWKSLSFYNPEYRVSDAYVYVYDISSSDTFKHVELLRTDSVSKYASDNALQFLIGNKCDLQHLREVPTETARAYAEENKMFFLEVSALDGTNIDLLFEVIAKELLKRKANYDEIEAKDLVETEELQTYRDVIDLFVRKQNAINPMVLNFMKIQRAAAACDTVEGIREKIREMKQVASASPAVLRELNKIFDENNRITIQDDVEPDPAPVLTCRIL